MKRLNLGCGDKIKKGYVNLDFIKQPGVDVVHDLSKFPWPFKDNEFDEVSASHLLEHVKEFEKTLLEIKRICKNRGIIKIRVPHFSCGVTYRDPTHRTFFSYFSFDYYQVRNNTYEKENELKFIEITWRELNFTRLAFPFLNFFINPFINFTPSIYERFFCWMLPCSEVLFKLRVVK